MKSLKGILTVLAILGVLAMGLYFNYNNKETRLRNQAEAQRKKIENVYDQMWKIISQKAQVSDEYKNGFKDIYTGIISGRYSQGDGTLMKWIQESNPNFDASLYKDLMQSIEVERNNFTREQNVMIDLIQFHTNLLTLFPSKYFISSSCKPIEYTVISSTRSKEVMQSGKDDDVDVFKK
jgi:hypothetical protein